MSEGNENKTWRYIIYFFIFVWYYSHVIGILVFFTRNCMKLYKNWWNVFEKLNMKCSLETRGAFWSVDMQVVYAEAQNSYLRWQELNILFWPSNSSMSRVQGMRIGRCSTWIVATCEAWWAGYYSPGQSDTRLQCMKFVE